jgi:hypothetical protein
LSFHPRAQVSLRAVNREAMIELRFMALEQIARAVRRNKR